LWIAIVGALLIAGAAAMGTVAVKDMGRLENIQASIREQKDIQREVQEGREELRKKTEEVGRELEALPDSLGALRTRRLMDHSFGLAKSETILEQKASRAEKRLQYLEGERRAVKSHFVRWSVVLGAVEFLLLGGIVVLALRAVPRR
jgi:predicted nuclease with TOPRIM domain